MILMSRMVRTGAMLAAAAAAAAVATSLTSVAPSTTSDPMVGPPTPSPAADAQSGSETVAVCFGGAVGPKGSAVLRSAEMLDLTRRMPVWEKLASEMVEPRRGAAATSLGDNGSDGIFVAGGWTGSKHTESAEMLVEGKWRAVKPMSHGRSCACAAVLDNEVYIIGGWDGENVLQSVEVYDLLGGSWQHAPSLQVPRKNASAVTLAGHVLVVGGWDGKNTLDSVEAYNKQERAWHIVGRLNAPRECAAAALIGCKLDSDVPAVVVVGGFNADDGVLSSAEVSDARGRNWQLRESSVLPLKRECLGAISINRHGVLVAGGWDGFKALREATAVDFDSTSSSAQTLAPLNAARNRPGMALTTKIHALGKPQHQR